MPADAPLRAAPKPKRKKKRYLPPASSRSDAAQTTAPAPKLGPPTPARVAHPLKTVRGVHGRAHAAVGVKARGNVAPTEAEIRRALDGIGGGVSHALEKLSPAQAYGAHGKSTAHGSGALASYLYHPNDPVKNVVKGAAATGVATYHDPIGVPFKTLKGGVEILKATPSGIVNTALHPLETLKGAARDYQHRYGQSFDEMVKRIRDEGAAPEVVDALTVASLGSATVGRAALSAAKGKGLKIATRARPAVRTSGGIVKEQALADTIGKVTRQRVHDRLRQRKIDKAIKDLDAGKPVDAVVADAVKGGQVVRLRPRKLDRSQAKAVAKTKSRAVHRMKSEQHRRVDLHARRALNHLNKHERKAYYYVGAGLAPAERAGFEKALTHRVESIKAERSAQDFDPTGLTRHTDELQTIPEINLDKVDFEKLAATHRDLRKDAISIGRQDPALNAAQRLLRRYAQQAEHLGIRRGETGTEAHSGVPAMTFGEEGVPAYIRRVQAAAKEANLERPVYFPSERFSLDLNPDYASRAAGGARAMATPGKYEGKNFRLGVQDTSPEAYLTGLSRNIKRKHNWKLVADLADEHAIAGLRGKAQLIRHELYQRGIDPKSYVLWNPKIFRGEMEKLVSDDPAIQSELADLHHGSPDDVAMSALAKSRDASGEYAQRSGWVAVPTKAWKEIEDSTKPSGALGRSWDIFKGKNSRILLGAGNIPWLQFQVASNALLAGFATRGTVVTDIVKARRWYNKLDDATKDEVDSLLGAGNKQDVHQPHLGAAANNSIVNGWRAFKDLPLWDAHTPVHSHRYLPAKGGVSLRMANPIEAMFEMDRWQTARFKRAVLYNRVKRQAFENMGEHITVAQKLQSRIAHALTLGPEAAMKAIVKDKALLEHHADAVNDWLGDYTTYTARERKVLSRSVMFYGFMRYSLKFAFYTMPVKHPTETAIVAKLGQLQVQEVKDLLGGDALPWSWGKLYLTHDGKLQEVDLARANPALNTLVDAASGKPAAWTSILPPMAVSLLEQAPGVGGRKFYFDRDWRVGGHSAEYGAKLSDIPAKSRALIFADEMAGMVAPYRIAEKLTQEGPQSDDSTLVHQIPMKYTGTDNRSKAIRKAIAAQKARDLTDESLLNELFPFLPQNSSDAAIIKEQAAVAEAAKPHPRKTHRSYLGSGSLGSGSLGSGGTYGSSLGGGTYGSSP
jgi:hypothetical protein